MERKNIQNRSRRVCSDRINYRETALLIERVCKGIKLRVGSKKTIPDRVIQNIEREMPNSTLKEKVKIARHVLNNIMGFKHREVKVKNDLTVINKIGEFNIRNSHRP